MMSRSDVLFAVLVAVTCFGLNVEAIKCYQCDDCPEKSELDLKECTKVSLLETMVTLVVKKKLDDDDKRAALKLSGTSENDLIKAAIETLSDANKSRNKQFKQILTSLKGPPATCFKMVTTVNNKEHVYRGCGHEEEPECDIVDDIQMCICKYDACNSAPSFGPILFVAFLTILISLLNV